MRIDADCRILQIMPEMGKTVAVFRNPDGTFFDIPVIGWALCHERQSGDESNIVRGLILDTESLSAQVLDETYGNFVEFAYNDTSDTVSHPGL